MTTFGEALLDAARGRQRVKRPDLWRAFQVAHPVEATAGDARERLMKRLLELVGEGRVTLPSERGAAWDRSARPPIPEWVALARPALPPPPVDATTVPWAPELAFVPRTPGVDLGAALAIQAFLAAGGRSRPRVPSRERSVQLFGDEKRLERLLRTPLFAEGRLDLGVLRCFSMAPPLVFEAGPAGSAGRPCLVVENHHTWWSFCQWNRRVGDYSAIVYGAGGGFGRDAVLFLDERCRSWGTSTAEYFGDLDRDGLLIPWRAGTQFAAPLALRLVPAERWYARLLERASEVALPAGAPIEVEADVWPWLPAALRAGVADLFARGVRVPQELVGLEELAQEPRAAAPADEAPF